MGPASVYIGKKNLPKKLFKIVNKKIISSLQFNIFIGHAQAEEDGEKLKALFEK